MIKKIKPTPMIIGECTECGKMILSTDSYFIHEHAGNHDEMFCTPMHCMAFYDTEGK